MEPTSYCLSDACEITVRHLTPDDYERVLTYFEGLSEASRTFFAPHPFDPDHARTVVETSDMTDTVRLGAFAGGAEGPMVGYFYYESREGVRYPTIGCGIIDEYHGKGLGQVLMDCLIAEAKRNGKPGLRLTVNKPNHRALRVYSKYGFRISGRAQGGSHHEMELDFAAEGATSKHRCMYLHPIDWKLTHLTADTWTLQEWQLYLDFIQAAGANMLKVFIWPTQYYHPDHPETFHNRWRFETLKQALAYAHALNLQTHVGFSANCVPPHVWLANPDKRATEVHYNGIHLCWQRGKDTITQFSGHLIEQFADVADGFIVWYADPGLCICEQCVPYTPVMLDIKQTYEALAGDRAQVHHCPWWIWHFEDGTHDPLPVTPNIRRDFLSSLPAGDWVPLYDQDPKSIDIAREMGLEVLSFAFFLDPEGGNEAHNVLPRTRFGRIEEAVASARERGLGLLAYRLTPYTQMAQDWLFFRKQLYPGISRERALGQLARFIGVGEQLVEALNLLDQWWEGGGIETLRSAAEIIRPMVAQRPEYMTHFAAALEVLLMLAEVGSGNDWQVTDELVAKVQEYMEQTSTFTAFTHEQLWDMARARPFIRQRLEWWMGVLAVDVGGR